ncbi:hypothetical protein BALOs_1534 [Halobacteriovorax sp. BALOs_7]|uniref:hypothetical protein n=1 Tax=Halobacteriovorax sp. BALOs_7 TaxID=2109558 RepID=UPI000EA1196D|nr:hypothetical protein [Halobacteriovorax sp. BALOs_7]AYF44535.1 hypothetical protein BALOs_1534 [Halobacteriovorax sp. BALOs_7]
MIKDIIKYLFLSFIVICLLLFGLFLFNPLTGGLGAYAIITKLRSAPSIFLIEDKSKTLRGVDSDNNGIRDDVYRYASANIYNFKLNKTLLEKYLRSFERTLELEKVSKYEARDIVYEYFLVESCVEQYIQYKDSYFSSKLMSLYFNTPERKRYKEKVFYRLDELFSIDRPRIYDYIEYGRHCRDVTDIDLFSIQFHLYREKYGNDSSRASRLDFTNYSMLINKGIKAFDVPIIKAFYSELDRRYSEGEFNDFKGW